MIYPLHRFRRECYIFISQKLTIGIRVRELLLLQALLDGCDDVINYVSEELFDSYNVDLSEYGHESHQYDDKSIWCSSSTKDICLIVNLLNFPMVAMVYL